MRPSDRSRGGSDIGGAPAGWGPDDGVDLDPRTIEPPTLLDRARLVALDGGLSAHLGARTSTLLGVVVIALVGGVSAWLLLAPTAAPPEDLIPLAAPSSVMALSGDVPTSTIRASILVHAAGAVVSPGLYELPADSRVADLLSAAGGSTSDADVDRLNLAQVLEDGTRVFVPRVGEVVPPELVVGAPAAGDADDRGPVDLNAATAEQLDELPGVGPATAEAILDHRAANGAFASVDELLDVRGIGEAKLEELRPLVTVG